MVSVTKKKPSTAFLILLNTLLFLLVLTWGGSWMMNPFALFMIVVALVFYAIISSVWHLILILIERKCTMKPMLRVMAFTAPFWAGILLSHLGIGAEREANKQYPAVSHNGRYVAKVDTYGRNWVVRIKDKKSGEKFKVETDFVAWLNVYWIWDDSNNLWLYNSDDGIIHVCRMIEGKWRRDVWGWTAERKLDDPDLYPPEGLLPDYAAERFYTD